VARPKSHELVDNLDRLSLGSFFESPDPWLGSVPAGHLPEGQKRQNSHLGVRFWRLPEPLKPCTQRDLQPTPRRGSAVECLPLEVHSSPKKHHPHYFHKVALYLLYLSPSLHLEGEYSYLRNHHVLEQL